MTNCSGDPEEVDVTKVARSRLIEVTSRIKAFETTVVSPTLEGLILLYLAGVPLCSPFIPP